MSEIRLPIVHTWRDGSFFFDGNFDFSLDDIGSMVVCERYSISEILEIRHLKRKTISEWGEVFYWIKLIDREWDFQHLGQATEQQIINDYKI